MKIMAIDYGDAHTGVAISDRTLTLTGFSTVITAYRPEAVIEKLLPLISEHEVSELVLGHPLNMDGTRGPRAEKAEGFAELLRETTSLPVTLWDERRTTVDAHNIFWQRQAREGTQENRRRRGSEPDARGVSHLQKTPAVTFLFKKLFCGVPQKALFFLSSPLCSQQRDERVHVLAARRPGGADAHDRVGIVKLLRKAHCDLLLQLLDLLVFSTTKIWFVGFSQKRR